MKLKYMKVSLFEISYKKKWTFGASYLRGFFLHAGRSEDIVVCGTDALPFYKVIIHAWS